MKSLGKLFSGGKSCHNALACGTLQLPFLFEHRTRRTDSDQPPEHTRNSTVCASFWISSDWGVVTPVIDYPASAIQFKKMESEKRPIEGRSLKAPVELLIYSGFEIQLSRFRYPAGPFTRWSESSISLDFNLRPSSGLSAAIAALAMMIDSRRTPG